MPARCSQLFKLFIVRRDFVRESIVDKGTIWVLASNVFLSDLRNPVFVRQFAIVKQVVFEGAELLDDLLAFRTFLALVEVGDSAVNIVNGLGLVIEKIKSVNAIEPGKKP